ncbi:endonuclease domain-containing protein [Rufibacter sediminis]|uniref:Endonuclease domain-containing protein n=1 Tax=Rufibacter sediminis TaxID=2762756 RepID=A0ABR6VNJ5_9BACT|nr:endonuclease domain-containing protein [Rufibacter sediminis]MBC3538737.1 endonuclease domain-containing protein [Rufibacter sediminis]
MPLNHYYNKNLKHFARVNRLDSTKAEIRMWCEVLGKGKTGYTFLRQRPVDRFIADFMCQELKLIIEVDGYSHQFKTAEDQMRDRALANMGFTVLRFTDEEVMKDISNVQRSIEQWIEENMPTR